MLFEYFKNAFRWTVVLLADQKTLQFSCFIDCEIIPSSSGLEPIFRDHSEMHDSLSIGPII